jgi:hypothetical protein
VPKLGSGAVIAAGCRSRAGARSILAAQPHRQSFTVATMAASTGQRQSRWRVLLAVATLLLAMARDCSADEPMHSLLPHMLPSMRLQRQQAAKCIERWGSVASESLPVSARWYNGCLLCPCSLKHIHLFVTSQRCARLLVHTGCVSSCCWHPRVAGWLVGMQHQAPGQERNAQYPG